MFLRSEGCGDPRLEASGCGKAYIKVNGKQYSKQKRGYNLVIVDYLTGTFYVYGWFINLQEFSLFRN